MTFLPKMTEHLEPGGVELDHAEVVAGGEVGVEPPTQAAVKALGAIDVRNRDDHDFEPHVDCLRFLASSIGVLLPVESVLIPSSLRFGETSCWPPSMSATVAPVSAVLLMM